jgi:hypothetical protein
MQPKIDASLIEALVDEEIHEALKVPNYKKVNVDIARDKLSGMLLDELMTLQEVWKVEHTREQNLYYLNQKLVKCSALCNKLREFEAISRDLHERSDTMKARHAAGEFKKEKSHDKTESA